MDSYKLPAIATLSTLPTLELATILDQLFEPCVPLHTLSIPLLRNQTFPTYDDLIASIGMQLMDLAESSSTSDTTWLESILAAHPRLGEKKIDSTQSKVEQAQLASDNEPGEGTLAELNALYERTFPGLRYVVFVNGRDRSTVIKDMQDRVGRNDIGLERVAAIKV